MIYIKAKFLAVREIPEQRPYPKGCQVDVQLGEDRLSFSAKHDVLAALNDCELLDEILFEAKPWTIYMARSGAKDKAFPMLITGIAQGEVR